MALCAAAHLCEVLQLVTARLVVLQEADSPLSVQQHPLLKGAASLDNPSDEIFSTWDALHAVVTAFGS